MKQRLILCLPAVFLFLFISNVHADELAELKEQMKEISEQNEMMKKQMEEQARQIETMRNKIEMLEVKEAREPGAVETPDTLAGKVEELEGEVRTLSEQQQAAIMSEILEKIKTDLYVTLEFESFEDSHSSFDARNVELLLEGEMTDRLKAFTEIEFERTAKTSGDTDNRAGEVEVEQGWVEYDINDYFNPRFGVILVPFGRFNLDHFDPLQYLTDRPVAMRRIIPTTWSEAGAGFTGRALLGNSRGGWFDDLSADYQFFVVNGLTNEFTDTGTRDARGAYGSDNNNNKATVGRLQFDVWGGQQIGISNYYGAYDTDGNMANGFDVDWKLGKGPFEFKGEYMTLALEEGGFESGSTTTVPGYMSGYYAQLAYTFWFDFLNKTFLGRGFEDPKFIGVVRYGESTIDDDGDINDGPNKEYGTTIGLNYRPNETFVYKFEYQFNHATNEPLERGDQDGFIGSVTAAF